MVDKLKSLKGINQFSNNHKGVNQNVILKVFQSFVSVLSHCVNYAMESKLFSIE